MNDLLAMIHARGNITVEEARKLTAKRKAATSKHRDRIDDGRAHLQRLILDYMRGNPDEWITCADVARAVGSSAQHVSKAMGRMFANGRLDCELKTTPVLSNGAYYMRQIRHFRLAEMG